MKLSFPTEVTVTGIPQITLTIGASSRTAAYVIGSGSRILTFRYTVVNGDNDADGITVLNTIGLGGGTLKFNSTENCNLVFTPPSTTSVLVDTISPTLSSVTAPANGTYGVNQTLGFGVAFSEPVVVTGSPRIALDVGGVTKYATYLTGSGSSTLTFRFTVGPSDTDNDGIALSSPVDLNLGTIKDIGGNAASLTFTPPSTIGILVAGANPVITSVTPPANATYLVANPMNFTVVFNKAVTITGTPRLSLNIGGTTKYADYVSGSGTASVLFRYTVISGDLDADGIGLSSPMQLNGGTVSDGLTNAAVLSFTPPLLTGVKVFTAGPSITAINLPGSVPVNGYDLGQNVDLTVVFSENITSTGTTSRLKLDVAGATKYATYQSGSGTSSFIYRYTVGAGEEDLNGLTVVSPLEANGSTLSNSGAVSVATSFTTPVTTSLKVDSVSPIILSNTVPAAATYAQGQNLDFNVTFSEPVFVTGLPRLTLDVGGVTKYASYFSGTGSSVIKFRYTVAAGDNDSNGIAVAASIDLNTGTINDQILHPSALGFPNTATSAVLIDNTAPTILSVTPPASGTYTSPQNLDFTVTFSEPVAITGSPRIGVDIGGTTRYAAYLSGTGTAAIKFRYSVTALDLDSNGIQMLSPVNLNGGTIKDLAANAATLTYTLPDTSGVLVGSVPSISSITLPANGEYAAAQNLDISVVFSEAVVVTLVPRMELTLNSGTVYANYVSGGGTNTLLFRYTVQSGDDDLNGVTLVSPLSLNGGAIQNLAMSQNATLAFTLPNSSGITVDTVNTSILSVAPPVNDVYLLGENLDFVVNFSANVTVTGTPQLSLTLGLFSVNATYVSGSGTNALTFRYTVVAGDEDGNGVTVASPVDLNSGTIKDATNDPALLSFIAPNTALVLVDGIVPTIASVTAPADGTYYNGDNIDLTVSTSENVTVSGSPRIQLTVGATTKYAVYLAGSGTNSLIFRYQVGSGDLDANGIAVTASLDLNSGTLMDTAGNGLTPLTFTAPLTSGIKVDGTNASIISLSAPANATYKTGNVLYFISTFSRPVTVSGTPRISLNLGGAVTYATYVSGSGTTALTFSYTVIANDEDADGIALNSPLELNGGLIKDSTNINAGLTFTAPGTSGILVDGVDIVIATFTPPANKTYKIAEDLDFTVNFNHPVTITGAPRIQLLVGASTYYATYQSGSGTTTTVFRYTVSVADSDNDGIDTIGASINLNGGTVKDSFGDAADLSFTATNYPNKKVDGIAPAIASVTPPADGIYYNDAPIDFAVNFSEAVNVSGVPELSLTIGAAAKAATYLSGSGTSSLVFRYTVASGDLDSNGIVSASPLNLSGGTILDLAGNSLNPLTFVPPATTGVLVDGTGASLLAVSAPLNTTYKTSADLDFVATFSRPVTVTGIPRIALTVGATTLYASYLSGSGTSALTFRYTVLPGHADSDGLALTGPVDLNAGFIKDSSNTNATLTFTSPNTSGVLIDGIDLAVASIGASADKTYLLSENIDFTVTYNYPAVITGSPRIQLDVGGATAYATYTSGSGTTALVFRYTIQSGDVDSDGIATVGPDIKLNLGSIKDQFGDDALRAFAATTYPLKKVDGVVPTLIGVAGPASGTYSETNPIDFVATFSDAVTVTGIPRIALTIGVTTQYAVYSSGSGTTALTFSYTVASGDSDMNGITSTSPIDLNLGSLKDGSGNPVPTLAFTPPNTAGVNVNATAATVTSVDAPAGSTYKTTNVLSFVVHYSRMVNVLGTPRIAITAGSSTVYANYSSGSGTSDLTFTYTVSAGDSDSDGIALTSPIVLSGGSIKDSTSANASLVFTLPVTTGIIVDGIDISISSVTPPTSKTYKTGEGISFTVVHNYSATVTGTPRIQLTIGASTRYADFQSGSGTTSHVYMYSVTAGDLDSDGIATVGPAVLPNGGTVKDAFGDSADLNFTAGALVNVKVDGVSPTVLSVAVSANKTYLLNETVNFTFTLSETVTVAGTPRVALLIDATTRYANYVSGSGTNTLVFTYQVAAGDLDADGIAVSTAAIDPFSGSITDAVGNAQTNFTFTAPALTGIKVDGVVPTVSSITPPTSQTYGNAAVLNFTVAFSEPVTVTNFPTLSLNLGGATKSAVYVSGSGSQNLVFRYTTVLNDGDTDGVASTSPLNLSGGTINDTAGNPATLTFSAATYAGVLVDAVPPSVSSVTVPAASAYKNPSVLSFTVIFNEIVNVVNVPRLQLSIGANTRMANYVSGSGSTSLVFSYTVATGDVDLDGIAIANSANIDLNTTGTIQDAILNNANLALGSTNTSRVYTVLPSMAAWYDLSDASRITLTGANVTGLTDKIGTYNLTHTGAAYSSTGFNGGTNAYATCTAATSFSGAAATTPFAIVAVFTAPTTTTSQYLFYTTQTTRPMVSFSSTVSFGTVTFGVTGSKYSAGAWSPAAATATGVWTAGASMARGFSWSATQFRANNICMMNGRLSEYFSFSAVPTPAEMTLIQNYLSSKHGLTFP
ncbi:MAG TPA: hypothetical protein VNJ01_04240 [Bacteriovoracaceae bacterium]|nr:hypothetical protein [Bacteriovoracaceae bacterium]